jgi:uncharacterized protein YndB with AHSA1/START domain
MTFGASREIAAPPSSVFAAFQDSERLDRLSAEVARVFVS